MTQPATSPFGYLTLQLYDVPWKTDGINLSLGLLFAYYCQKLLEIELGPTAVFGNLRR